MVFLDDKYLLSGDQSVKIFNEIRKLPILDAHNHGNAHEILENKNYSDIWQVEGATDHYIWELMRKRGIKESFITGNATNKEKWMKLARIFPDFVGNPVFEWVHLDLKNQLGITDLISSATAESIWEESKKILSKENKKPQALLKEMNIESMCTTNDPIEMLEDYIELSKKFGKGFIRPTWRPDRAMNIFNEDWTDYIVKLGKRTNIKIKSLDNLISALKITHDNFAEYGCIASDHGMEMPVGYRSDKDLVEEITHNKLIGKEINEEEQIYFMSYLMHEFAKMDAAKGWVMQLHIGAVRDVRDMLLKNIGPDSGGDVSDHKIDILEPIVDFLNEFDENNEFIEEKYRGLKVILYSMDPSHYSTLATLSRAFGKNIALGSAWWFNNSPIGMRRQLEYIMSVDLLMNFAGMVTDSRKILSYGSKIEMFRRVLSDVLGKMVEKGQIPEDLAIRVAKYVCYNGPKRFFNF